LSSTLHISYLFSSNFNCLDTYEAIRYSKEYCLFGMIMPGRTYTSSTGYRYGFGGQEKDDEISGNGNSYTAEYWEYDARLGRRWNRDPVVKPWESGYATFGNNPIYFADPTGLDKKKADEAKKKNDDTKAGTTAQGDTYTDADGRMFVYNKDIGWELAPKVEPGNGQVSKGKCHVTNDDYKGGGVPWFSIFITGGGEGSGDEEDRASSKLSTLYNRRSPIQIMIDNHVTNDILNSGHKKVKNSGTKGFKTAEAPDSKAVIDDEFDEQLEEAQVDAIKEFIKKEREHQAAIKIVTDKDVQKQTQQRTAEGMAAAQPDTIINSFGNNYPAIQSKDGKIVPSNIGDTLILKPDGTIKVHPKK
jgi:RHS repeat-associated protein